MCDCIEKMNEALKKQGNTELVAPLIGPKFLFVESMKRDVKKREKAAHIIASYCPFCGEKYPE